MTCSSSTTFTPERRARARRLALPGALALAVAAVLAGPGQADDSGSPAALIAAAERDLAKGDGIAAEVRLKQALARGATRPQVAAMMGEALIAKGDGYAARDWLSTGGFTPRTAARGWRNLARLERIDGHLMASSLAYDNALRAAPRDATTWIEVAYLRFALGNYLDGIDAGERALALDPANVRALEFKGNLVRDQFGQVAALPWYEAALQVAPDDRSVLGAYAATLGELGRARDMLVVTRHMLAIDGGDPRAHYLQAVLAARAGNFDLARAMLNHGGRWTMAIPGAQLLSATIDLSAGNPEAAMTTLGQLLNRQPGNRRAEELMARALYLAGNDRDLIARFAGSAASPMASPYMLTTLARAYERLGDRAAAAPLLDRAAREYSRPIAPVPGNAVGGVLAAGNGAAASAQAAAAVAANPANAAAHAIAGDVALAEGRAADAAADYRLAARVRMSDSMLAKLAVALEVAGRGGEAARAVDAWLAQNPASRPTAWLAASVARREGDWNRAVLLLRLLDETGGDDVNVKLALAQARLRTGDRAGALDAARAAYRLQRGSGYAAEVYGAALRAQAKTAEARALAAKARAMAARYDALPPVRYAFAAPR